MWGSGKGKGADEATKISELDVEHFTRGDCHLLARAIHHRTGWPMHTFWKDVPGGHAFVITPSGWAFDVKGLHALEEMCVVWRCSDHRPVSWHHLLANGWPRYERLTSIKRAEELAPLLVELADPSPTPKAARTTLTVSLLTRLKRRVGLAEGALLRARHCKLTRRRSSSNLFVPAPEMSPDEMLPMSVS